MNRDITVVDFLKLNLLAQIVICHSIGIAVTWTGRNGFVGILARKEKRDATNDKH